MSSDHSRKSQPQIPLCVPELRGHEREYIDECIETNFVSSVGPFVKRFEDGIAARVGLPYAVATVNGTAALHIALIVAGVKADDEVLVSTLSFIAPANAIRYAGAWPVFVDAEPTYWEMDVDKLADFVANRCVRKNGKLVNRDTGRRVSAILPVHILGHPVDMSDVMELASKYELIVVEDATESLGALYDGRTVGSIGHIACFSFNGNKLITAGGGGMIVTADEAWARRAKYLTTQAKDDPIEFVHNEIGYNYRLTNIQAALGCAQLEVLDEYLTTKRAIAARYDAALRQTSWMAPMKEAPWAHSAFWLYTALVDANQGSDRHAVAAYLASMGVQTRPLWQPLHLSPAHVGAPHTDCSVAEDLNARALSLPCSVGLNEVDQSYVIEALRAWSPSNAGAVVG
jgi:perosamine synthetase